MTTAGAARSKSAGTFWSGGIGLLLPLGPIHWFLLWHGVFGRHFHTWKQRPPLAGGGNYKGRRTRRIRKRKKNRGTAQFLVLTLRLQHLQGGFGSGPGLPLGFGQQLALLLQTLLALLLLLLLLLPALQLQAFLRFKRSALTLKAQTVGG